MFIWMNNVQILKFVHCVDRAPMWINKNLFMEKLHHIDYSFAPFMGDDQELCLRSWLNGLLVDGITALLNR